MRHTKLFAPLLLSFLGAFLFADRVVARQNGAPVRAWTMQPVFTESPRGLPSLVNHREIQRPRVGLVLSGGGARGIASIGVIEAFEEAGIPIDFIVGTSIGSIIGGLYSAGYSLDQLKALVDSTNWGSLLSLGGDARRKDLFYDQKLADDRSILVFRFDGFTPILPESFSTGQRLTHYLNVLVLQSVYNPVPTFDHLKIPFRAVATDLISGTRFVLDRGDLTEALRASVTVPLLFSPVQRDTTMLLDGGLTSNIPADVARDWGADIVVAVDVTSPLRSASELNAPWEVADQIIGIAMQLANKEQLKAADYVIRPNIGNHLSSDFSDLDFLIAEGKAATAAVIGNVQGQLRHNSDSNETVFRLARFEYDSAIIDEPWAERIAELGTRQVRESSVRQFLNDLYETGAFEHVMMQVKEYSDTAVFTVEARPNPVLNRVEIRGNAVVSSDTLRSSFDWLLGKKLNAHASQQAMEQLLEIYRNGGYSLARIQSASLDPSSGVATITVNEGIVHRRTIIGTKKTKDYVIWRELPWNEGEVFQVSKVAEGLNNLYSTNLFEQISIKTERSGGTNAEQVVVLNIRERYTDLIRLGMTIDNERNVQPSIDLRDENFLGIGSELGLRFFGGLRNRYYLGEFKANRIFNSYLTFNLKGYYDLRDVNVFSDENLQSETRWNRVRSGEYRDVRQGASMAFGTQLERLGLFTVEGRHERQRIWNIFGQPLDTTREYTVSSLKIGTRIDSRDEFPYPRDGVVMDFWYESGIVSEHEKVGFTKMLFSYEWFKTLFPNQTIRPKILFGFGDETVPITEQFRLGGHESFFGYREDNARGRQLFMLSLQYRFQLPVNVLFDTYVIARYDLGHIWEKAEQIRIKDLRHGVGLTLALDTPIGPAEFSIARAFFIRKDLFESPLSYGPFATYFKIGYAF
ncbi:MAG: patatin-like phospholipase family protein [Bacteroidota bacterium]